MLPVLSLLVVIATSTTTSEASCSFQRDGYEVSWTVGTDQRVHFQLNATAPANQSNWWTAIAFGEGHNTGLDIIMVIVENNQARLMDRKSVSYGGSVPTQWQHTTKESIRLENGRVYASFYRALVTNILDDNPLGNCMPWAFPFSGGVTLGDGKIVQHFQVPERRHICNIATRCLASPGETSPTASLGDEELQKIEDEKEIISTNQQVQTTLEQCSFQKNDYNLRWWEEGGQVVFDLRTKAPKDAQNWWTAVGFGNGHIAGLDVLMAIVENGTIRVFDRKSVSYAGSVLDEQQDVTVYNTSLRDGTLRVLFSRPLITDDPQDNPIDQCAIWAFPYSGGTNVGNWKVVMHNEVPERRRICDVALNCKRSPTDNSILPLLTARQRSSNNLSPISAPLNGAISLQDRSIPFSSCLIASLVYIGYFLFF
uniref:DOMON domain-containing protein n=1 Tax=Plectus sambesii TaxID=2011161 RepID=A0A914WDR4_9BILA